MTHELQSGSKLGKYEIHGRLSAGGMAELYLASLGGQGGFRKFVALKRVLPTIAQDEDFTRMFLDEARITASLSHAAIAQVYELAEDPQTHEPVLAMEYIAGQNLEQLVKRARRFSASFLRASKAPGAEPRGTRNRIGRSVYS